MDMLILVSQDDLAEHTCHSPTLDAQVDLQLNSHDYDPVGRSTPSTCSNLISLPSTTTGRTSHTSRTVTLTDEQLLEKARMVRKGKQR